MRSKLVRENAAGVSGFDLDTLRLDIERVGFDIDGQVVRRPG